MKLGIIEADQFLVLENIEDAKLFFELDAKIKAKQSINLWLGVKSQPSNFVRSAMSYASHEAEGNDPVAQTMATALELTAIHTGKDVSLVEYCKIADKYISEFHEYILSEIQEGNFVRLNKMACGCSVNDLTGFDSYQDINELETYNFMLSGEINMDFSIKNKIVVLENSTRLPINLVKNFNNITNTTPEELQIITSFKKKSILFKKSDFVKFFLDGVKNGLQTIVCDTTGQDVGNIKELKDVIEYVAKTFPYKTFNAYISTYRKELFSTNLPNINVVFI